MRIVPDALVLARYGLLNALRLVRMSHNGEIVMGKSIPAIVDGFPVDMLALKVVNAQVG